MTCRFFFNNFRNLKLVMTGMKVFVSNKDISQTAINSLAARFDTIVNPEDTKESILAYVSGVDAVLWASRMKIDKEVLDAAGPQIKMVAAMSAGVDHIDKEELKKRGIKLSNAPMVPNSAVADVALLLTLAASRRLQEGRRHIENGTWQRAPNWMLGQDIEGSMVGIVGLGGIGQSILKKLKPFHIKKFLYCGHKEKKEGDELGAEFVPFDDLLTKSDFVVVSCPLTAETKQMFNETAFSKMKKTAVFVNVARGEIVDQPALIKALKKGTIFAAGLDVMTPEPLPQDHELLTLPNCVLIPHLGSATVRTREEMAELAAKNIIMALDDKPLLTPVD